MSSERRQFGADTVITAQVRLILMDCFDTLVQLDEGRYRARNGIAAFLDHFAHRRQIPVAVISDAAQDVVTQALRQSGLLSIVQGVFHGDNAAVELPDGRRRKRLEIPLEEFGVPATQAVFIGDSPLDAEAAKLAGVPFIRVPRGEDAAFSFAKLIDGPSRYDSQEFFERVQEAYAPAPRTPIDPTA